MEIDVVDKLKKQGYRIVKGKFDREAYADFFGVGEGVQADEFANAGLAIVRPLQKIKVFRGVGKNVKQGENDAIQWVAEDERVAKNYSSKKEVIQLEVNKPQNPFENPENNIYVTNNDVANRLRKIRDKLFRAKSIDKKQAELATSFIDEFERKAGGEPELYSTKTNKDGVADLYAKALVALGYDGIIQKESFDSKSAFQQTTTENTSNTYGVFNPELVKAVEDLLGGSQQPSQPIPQSQAEPAGNVAVEGNEALRDVESTAKALEKGNGNAEYSKEGALNVAKNYHKAKKDGTNPELVKAVEDLLGKPKAVTPNVEDWSSMGIW